MSVEIAAQSQHLKGELRSLIRFYDFFCLFSPAPLVESWFKMQWAMLGRKLGNWMLVAPQLYCHVYALPCLSFRLHRGRAGYNWNLTRVFWSCFVAHFVAFLLCSFLFHPRCGPDKTSVTSQSPSSFLSHLDERRDREWRQRMEGTDSSCCQARDWRLDTDRAVCWWTPCIVMTRSPCVLSYHELPREM